MKKASTYIISVLLTLLLVFVSIAACAAGVFRFVALQPDTALGIVDSEKLADRVHSSLETEFRQRESTTGIPSSVYANAIKPENLKPIIRDTVTNGFAYLQGESNSLNTDADFSKLEKEIRVFFENYAAENKIEKNESFDLALRKTTDNAETLILNACDVFRFATLDDAGVFQKLKPYLPWASTGTTALFAAAAVLVLLLFLVNFHEAEHGFYWVGTALIIASAVLMIPAMWLEKTRWFDRFSVKTDQTFAAVTGYLYTNTHAVVSAATAGIIISVLLFLLFTVLHLHRGKTEVSRSARH